MYEVYLQCAAPYVYPVPNTPRHIEDINILYQLILPKRRNILDSRDPCILFSQKKSNEQRAISLLTYKTLPYEYKYVSIIATA